MSGGEWIVHAVSCAKVSVNLRPVLEHRVLTEEIKAGANSSCNWGGEMNTESNNLQSSSSRPSIVWPVIMILVGMLALWLPRASSIGVARLLGWLMVFEAAAQLIHSFSSQGVGHVGWKVLVALIYLIAGIYFLTHPFLEVAVVTLALAMFFLVEGLIDVFSYFATRKAGASYWILMNGIVGIILTAMIWRHWPTRSL